MGKLSNKDSISEWEVEEAVEFFQPMKKMYEKEEVDSYLSDISSKVDDALDEIKEIEGIDKVDECKKILNEILSKLS